MAKLNAPLLSFGASGKIADALVFFPWKGINAVRQFVVPANPKTTAQQTQRGYLADAVAAIHAAQAMAGVGLIAIDIAAYALWGSCFATPRTWFNQICKNWIDQHVAGKKGCIYRSAGCTPGNGQLAVNVYNSTENASQITAGDFWYGTSKTALINSKAATVAGQGASATITGLTNGVKYYWQFRPTAHADYVGCHSGIYTGTPEA